MSYIFDFKNHKAIDPTALMSNDKMAWLNVIQEKAWTNFTNMELPARKIEHWKYNQMAFLTSNTFRLATPLSAKVIAEVSGEISSIQLPGAIHLTFVDGYLITDLNQQPTLDGLSITRYVDTTPEQQALVERISMPSTESRNMLMNLNSALANNGILIEVSKKTKIETPIYIRHFTSRQTTSTLASQNIVIHLNEFSDATLIEQFESTVQQENQLALQQTHVMLSDNSKLDHYRLNLEHESSKQISQVKTILSKNSSLNSFYLGSGSQLNRTDIDTIHSGENSECSITGIYLPAKKQTIDYHTNTEHQVPHCNSNEIFRGIIADEASATFNGKIHIFQDAQKSDARLNNKNLLLTNKAEINTKPELEIYADDVKCAHGATVAQLDNKAIYYLQTRGINRQQATKMLSVGFINELIEKINIKPIQEFLFTQLEDYMSHI